MSLSRQSLPLFSSYIPFVLRLRNCHTNVVQDLTVIKASITKPFVDCFFELRDELFVGAETKKVIHSLSSGILHVTRVCLISEFLQKVRNLTSSRLLPLRQSRKMGSQQSTMTPRMESRRIGARMMPLSVMTMTRARSQTIHYRASLRVTNKLF